MGVDGIKMGVDGLFFGSIGSLVHCSELQWQFFNQALDFEFQKGTIKMSDNSSPKTPLWDAESYAASLMKTGGKLRLTDFFKDKGIVPAQESVDIAAIIKDIYAKKSELFVEYIKTNAGTEKFKLRPGVLDLLKACKQHGIKTAFVTTTNKPVMEGFVKHLGLSELVDLTISEDDLPHFGNVGKPSPDCYWYAVRKLLGEDSCKKNETGSYTILKNCIAIEDTWISLQAPVSAGFPWTLAIPSEWASKQDFSQASVKVDELTDLESPILERVAKMTTMPRGAQGGAEGLKVIMAN